MDITIIIPMKDTEDQIMKCLDSIKINTLSRDRYEVIIIDDASKLQNFYQKNMIFIIFILRKV